MACVSVPFELPEYPLPADVRRLVDDAHRRAERFFEAGSGRRYPRFVPSEAKQVYATLRHIREQRLAPGDRFLEWGSGFGTATCLAALLGYDASGIEIETELVAQAERIAVENGIAAAFIEGDFIPAGYSIYEAFGGPDLIPESHEGYHLPSPPEDPAYPEMDGSIAEIDLFFAYPWPAEQELMLKLFETFAGEGALFAAYYGDRDIELYRKAGPGIA